MNNTNQPVDAIEEKESINEVNIDASLVKGGGALLVRAEEKLVEMSIHS